MSTSSSGAYVAVAGSEMSPAGCSAAGAGWVSTGAGSGSGASSSPPQAARRAASRRAVITFRMGCSPFVGVSGIQQETDGVLEPLLDLDEERDRLLAVDDP